MRTIVLIPAHRADQDSEYFENFVWHIRRWMEDRQIQAHVIVASLPPVPGPPPGPGADQ